MANQKCPMEGCDREMNKSRMRMHLVNSHDLRGSEAKAIMGGTPVSEVLGQAADVAQLREQLTAAEGRTMHDYPSTEKAKFVIDFCRALPVEDQVKLAAGIGLPIRTEAVLNEDERPIQIDGKTDLEGYKYYPELDMSIRE